MRKKILCANWKMNKTRQEMEDYFEDFLAKDLATDQVDVVVAVPDLLIDRASQLVADHPIHIGAQNTYPKESGAYTGETSVSTLADLGVTYVIVGHSERRELFQEDDDFINEKVKAVFDHGMTAILCVGESLEEKEAGQTISRITDQIEKGLKDVSAEDVRQLVVGYEPVWAIGTGKTASPEEAQEAAVAIREKIADLYDADTADQVRIQYGGSAKPDNIVSFVSQEDIDGGLIGGAGLEADSFAEMIKRVGE